MNNLVSILTKHCILDFTGVSFVVCELHFNSHSTEVKQLGLKLVPTWDASIAGGRFTHCATMLAPHNNFKSTFKLDPHVLSI